MRCLLGAAVVPAAPLLLPEVSPAQPEPVREDVARLRELSREAIASLPRADVTVVVAAGPRGIHDSAVASLAPLGVPWARAELPVPTEAVEHLSRLVQHPMLRGDELGVALAVLALQVRDVRGIVPVLPLSVPAGTDFDVLTSVGASIAEAVEDAGLTATVVAAGDLSAGLHESSPRWRIDGAERWDAEAVRAFADGELKRLRDLGPEEAERVAALGWAPLAVLHGLVAAGGLAPELLGYLAPLGVGQLVGRCTDGQAPPSRYERPAEQEQARQGVVPRTGDPRG